MEKWEKIYIEQRLTELDVLFQRVSLAINNLDARLMLVERLLASIQKSLEGEDYDETKQIWWN